LISIQRRRMDIQGLRALAILPVVLYHAKKSWMPGGFVGVDIFFVISGYLITRILLREIELGRFSIFNFYERRIKRIFPALTLVLLLTIIMGVWLLPPEDLSKLGKSSIATMVFASNLYFFKTTNYFADSADLQPLLHTWSLSVEEQFYILFPVILWMAYRRIHRWLKFALWGIAVLSLLLCVWTLNRYPEAAFYLPMMRAYELLVGSILAANAVPRIKSTRMLDGLFLLKDYQPFPGFVAR
jgi:peptidoglycan/LPS O-acetylase OafA/YrhL